MIDDSTIFDDFRAACLSNSCSIYSDDDIRTIWAYGFTLGEQKEAQHFCIAVAQQNFYKLDQWRIPVGRLRRYKAELIEQGYLADAAYKNAMLRVIRELRQAAHSDR